MFLSWEKRMSRITMRGKVSSLSWERRFDWDEVGALFFAGRDEIVWIRSVTMMNGFQTSRPRKRKPGRPTTREYEWWCKRDATNVCTSRTGLFPRRTPAMYSTRNEKDNVCFTRNSASSYAGNYDLLISTWVKYFWHVSVDIAQVEKVY